MTDYRFSHLSIRVPWHDSGWNGHVCRNPLTNQQCSVLPYMRVGKDSCQKLVDLRMSEKSVCS